MARRAVQRGEVRHWLPSQGVDAAQHLERIPGTAVLPPLLSGLRQAWADLPAQAVRRLSAAPFSLFDAGFASSPRWLELRASGVHDQTGRADAFFEPAAARSVTRRMLVYGWHLARSRPRAACLVFGATLPAVEALAACSLAALEAAAERNGDALRPRWAHQPVFWRELLLAASAGADQRLHELLLGGVQRLAAETLAAHSL
jgi:hypothetical protein